MRKLFTLFAAFVTLISVAAGPQFVKKANLTKHKPVYGHQLTPRAGQKPAKIAAATSQRMHGQKVSFANAPKIKRGQAYEYTYNECTYTGYQTDTWFTLTTSDQAYKFYFDILLPESELEENKTYTLDDCDRSFSYLSDNTTYAMTKFSDVEIVLTKGDDGKFILEANCITIDGNSYHLTYQELVYPETFTDVAVGNLEIRLKDFTSDMGVFQFTGVNDEYDLGLCMESDGQIAGTWTTDNVYDGLNNYTYLYKDGKEVKLCDVEMQVTSLGANNYHIDAKMYAYDGNVYLLNHDYIEPTLQNTADIVATNFKIDDSIFEFYKGMYGYGLANISASNDEYTITGSILSFTTIPGHYDDEDHLINELYITDATGVKTGFFSNDLDIALVDGSWTLQGKVLCWDNTEYNLDLTFTIPDVTGEGSFTSTEGELVDLTSSLGAIQIYAMDEDDNEFSVVFNTDAAVSGHYDEISEEFKNYCYLYYENEVYQMYSGDFQLETDQETFTLSGTCHAGELLWTINLSGIYTAEEEEPDAYDATPEFGEIDVNYTLDEIVDYEISPEEGYFYLSVENAERRDSWACMIFIDGYDLSAGEYPFTETYEPGTAQPGLIYGDYLYPTMYFQYDEDGYITLPVWYCSHGSITVDYDANGDIIMDCDALNSNGVRVHVTVNAQDPAGIQQVADKALKNGKYVEQNRIVIRSNGQKYNTIGQQIK